MIIVNMDLIIILIMGLNILTIITKDYLDLSLKTILYDRIIISLDFIDLKEYVNFKMWLINYFWGEVSYGLE